MARFLSPGPKLTDALPNTDLAHGDYFISITAASLSMIGLLISGTSMVG